MRLGILISIVLFTGSVFSQGLIPPRAEVVNVQMDGSGCDASNARAIFTQDVTTLSVLYDNFIAEIGKGTAQPKAKSAEKKCTVLIDVVATPGWSFNIASVEYRGFIEAPDKTTLAYQLASIESNGLATIGFEQALIKGPYINNHSLVVKNKNLGLLKNSMCDGSPQRLRVKTLIGVRNLLAAIGFMRPKVSIGVDSADGQINQRFVFNWKKCGL